MRGQAVGSFIGALFGLVYVVVNSGPLPAAAQWPLRALGVLGFVGAVSAVLSRRGRSPSHPDSSAPQARVFSRSYWLVVLAEAVALFGGVRVLSGPLALPEAGVAWVSLVVGVHFFALALVFGQRFFHLLGAVIATCGAVGFGLVLAGAREASVSLVGGVLPGVTLLAFAWWGAARIPRTSHVDTPGVTQRTTGAN